MILFVLLSIASFGAHGADRDRCESAFDVVYDPDLALARYALLGDDRALDDEQFEHDWDAFRERDLIPFLIAHYPAVADRVTLTAVPDANRVTVTFADGAPDLASFRRLEDGPFETVGTVNVDSIRPPEP